MAPFLVVGVIVAFVVSIVQVGWKVSTKPMQPKLDKFNPISGFKRMFSKESVFELFKSCLLYTSITPRRKEERSTDVWRLRFTILITLRHRESRKEEQ